MALIAASTIFSPTPELALWGAPYRHTGLVTCLCLALVFIYCIRAISAQDSRLLLTLFFLSGAALAIISIGQFTVGTLAHTLTTLTDVQRNRYAATAGNIDFLAAYLLMTGIAGVGVVSRTPRRWLIVSGLVITQAAIVLSLCRGVWMAELVVIAWLLRGLKPRTGLLALAAVAAMFAILFVFSAPSRERVGAIGRIISHPNMVTGDRVYFWGESLEELGRGTVKEFMVGTGPDTFRARVPDLYGKAAVVDKPHNVYLDYLLCLGIPASLLIGAFILSVCLAPHREDLARYCKLIILAYWVQAFFGIDAVMLLPCQAVILALLAVMARDDIDKQ